MGYFATFVVGGICGLFTTALLTNNKIASVEEEWSEAFHNLNERYINLRKKYYDKYMKEPEDGDV